MTNSDQPIPKYRCPVCDGDEHRYVSCQHPGCPDGRDRGHPHRFDNYPDSVRRAEIEHPHGGFLRVWPLVLALAICLIVISLLSGKARALDHGFDPTDKTVQWFESLQRPDAKGSCCGKADAYPVSNYWDNGDGSHTLVIGDGSAKKYPDGSYRPYLPTGAEIVVPDSKINRREDDLDNPTDTSWLFVAVYAGIHDHIYCAILHPSGN